MATLLVTTSPARGHLYPLVPTLLELKARGHRVHVRTLAKEVELLRQLGLEASPMAVETEGRTLDDWKARTPLEAAGLAFSTWLDRAEHEAPDLRAAISEVAPDVLVIDVNSWGSLAAAEASRLPFAVFSPYFLNVLAPGRPPFGLGLAPGTGWLTRLRDAFVRMVMGWAMRGDLARLNKLRSGLGLPALGRFELLTAPAHRVLAYTAEPFEYVHGGWPANVRLVGPGIWEPPDVQPLEVPGDRPLVLVTCSTEFQNDGALIHTALAALEGVDVDVVATTAALDPADFKPPANAHVVRYAAHGPLLRRAAAVVCHGGMGITQKALAAGVPVCVVPWGRDQVDVGRHVEQAEAGVLLPKDGLTAEALRAAVEKTRARRPGAERLARAFAESPGARGAADVLEALSPGRAPP